jgi:hypothetical protein
MDDPNGFCAATIRYEIDGCGLGGANAKSQRYCECESVHDCSSRSGPWRYKVKAHTQQHNQTQIKHNKKDLNLAFD